MKQRITTPANEITQSEFLDKFASNQIVGATVVVNQQSLPLEDITGTYLETARRRRSRQQGRQGGQGDAGRRFPLSCITPG